MRRIPSRLRNAAPTVLLALASALASACSSGSTRSASAADAGDGGPKQVEGPDAGPSPGQITLAAGITAYNLRVDATNVYASTETSIVKVPVGGGSPVTLASVSQGNSISGLAVSSDSVYWSETAQTDGGSEVLILSVPIAGGAVATFATTSGFASALATDATSLYWSGSAAAGSCPSPPCSTLSKAPLAGGTPLVLDSNAGNPTYLAFDDANVYWSTSDGRLLEEPKNGGTVTTLADFSTSIVGLGLQGSTLYWGTSGGDVYATPSGGGTSKPDRDRPELDADLGGRCRRRLLGRRELLGEQRRQRSGEDAARRRRDAEALAAPERRCVRDGRRLQERLRVDLHERAAEAREVAVHGSARISTN